jgi:alkenylglycerophosphocholine/alkenylglycerophosphoethanolamine hydrolase
MAWRSVARLNNFKSIPQILCALGGVSFAISDTLIAFNLFLTPIKYAQIYIMVTYYFAQLGLTLSVLDIEKKERKSR